ncbi:MAG: hypothetical protein KAI55_02335, partial [Candidatus Aenigmarchaeota archaeon]|nr:hypothetical protein [Candidatus Aenigmarchaeota archaeon]
LLKKKESDKETNEERENNSISKKDIEELELKENGIKKGFLDKIKSYVGSDKEAEKEIKEDSNTKSKEENPTDAKRNASLIKNILKEIETDKIDTEKIDAKLDSEKEIRSALSEQINELSERLGELRAMILDREKSFNEIENKYAQMKVSVEMVDPALIKHRFEKLEILLTEMASRMEKNTVILEKHGKDLHEFEENINKIKSFDNIVDVFKEISKKAETIKNTEIYVNHRSSKLESMFFEFEKNLVKIDDLESRLNSFDEVGKELMLTTSGLEESQKNYLVKSDKQNIEKELLKEMQIRLSGENKRYEEERKKIKNILVEFDKMKGNFTKQINKKLKEQQDEIIKNSQDKINRLDTEMTKINSMLEIPSFQIFLKNMEDNKTYEELMENNKKETLKYVNEKIDMLMVEENKGKNELNKFKKSLMDRKASDENTKNILVEFDKMKDNFTKQINKKLKEQQDEIIKNSQDKINQRDTEIRKIKKSLMEEKNKLNEYDKVIEKMIDVIRKTFMEQEEGFKKNNKNMLNQANMKIITLGEENKAIIEKCVNEKLSLNFEEIENTLKNNILDELRIMLPKPSEKKVALNNVLNEQPTRAELRGIPIDKKIHSAASGEVLNPLRNKEVTGANLKDVQIHKNNHSMVSSEVLNPLRMEGNKKHIDSNSTKSILDISSDISNKNTEVGNNKEKEVSHQKKKKGLSLEKEKTLLDTTLTKTKKRVLDEEEERINKYLRDHGYDTEVYGIK